MSENRNVAEVVQAFGTYLRRRPAETLGEFRYGKEPRVAEVVQTFGRYCRNAAEVAQTFGIRHHDRFAPPSGYTHIPQLTSGDGI